MTLTLAALSNHGAWGIALIIGLVAALAVAALLVVLIRTVNDIDQSAGALLDGAGKVAANTANIPQLQATAPVLSEIVTERPGTPAASCFSWTGACCECGNAVIS